MVLVAFLVSLRLLGTDSVAMLQGIDVEAVSPAFAKSIIAFIGYYLRIKFAAAML